MRPFGVVYFSSAQSPLKYGSNCGINFKYPNRSQQRMSSTFAMVCFALLLVHSSFALSLTFCQQLRPRKIVTSSHASVNSLSNARYGSRRIASTGVGKHRTRTTRIAQRGSSALVRCYCHYLFVSLPILY